MIRKTTLSILLLLMVVSGAMAAPRLNYVAANFPEASEDNQGRWSTTIEVPVSNDPLAALQWLGLPALPFDIEAWAAYGVDGVGFLDEESSPVNLDHNVETYLKLLGVDAGFKHVSTGEVGAESEGKNLLFIRRNVEHRSESVYFDASVTGFMFIDAENDITREIRAFGDTAKWGLEALARGVISFDHKEWIELQAEVKENWAFFSIGVLGNPDRLYTPFVYVYTGKGATLEARDAPERALGVGASFDAW